MYSRRPRLTLRETVGPRAENRISPEVQQESRGLVVQEADNEAIVPAAGTAVNTGPD